MKKFTCWLAAALLATASVNAQNLLLNPGFEDGAIIEPDWSLNPGWSVIMGDVTKAEVISGTSPEDVRTGSKAAFVKGEGGQTRVSNLVEINEKAVYEVSFWYKFIEEVNKDATTIRLEVSLSDADFGWSGKNVVLNATSLLPDTYNTPGEWHLLKGDFDLSSYAGDISVFKYISFDIIVEQATILVDDCSLVKKGGASINETNGSSTFTLSSNSIKDEAHFTFESANNGAHIIIADLTGKIVAQQAVATGVTEASISVSNLSDGVYVARYSDSANKGGIVKFVK